MIVNKLDTYKDLEDLFIWLNEPLYRYIYIRCGYNREIAEDITQDVFIKVWEKRQSFNPKKSTLKNWIFIIARNYIIDIYRKKKPNIVRYSEEIQDILPDNDISDIQKNLITKILTSLDYLKDIEKESIILKYIQELEIKDISQIINKNQTATKVMIHRAIKKLKIIINEKTE